VFLVIAQMGIEDICAEEVPQNPKLFKLVFVSCLFPK